MGVINVRQASNQGSIETWTPTDHLDHTYKQPDRQLQGINAQQSVFTESKEAYRLEVVADDHGSWPKRKVRVRSVDVEDSEVDHNEPIAAASISRERNVIQHTRSTCKKSHFLQLCKNTIVVEKSM